MKVKEPYLSDLKVGAHAGKIPNGNLTLTLTVAAEVILTAEGYAAGLEDSKGATEVIKGHMREALAELGVDDSKLPRQ